MNDERNREYFKETFGEIHAPSALVGKVMDMTENNERKARPVITKKVIIIAAVVALVLAATLTAVSVNYDRARQISFGNSQWWEDVDAFVVDPETGEEWLKPEYIFTMPKENMIFDFPAIIDKDKLPIPEGYELSHEDIRTLEEAPPYHTSWVVYHYTDINSYKDENGTTMVEGKWLSVTVEELYEDTEVSIEHDGEMFRTKVGDVDLYYYSEERIPTDLGFEHDVQETTYLAVGEKYRILITASVYDTNCEVYDWDDLPTLEEISAIIEAIDNMIYPD
ncbi:MAG: hypothetical protein IJ424_06960 [Oscillospiraceae bacterium]|nr:hypothetical protein [Oscillospiraceae bacterium]